MFMNEFPAEYLDVKLLRVLQVSSDDRDMRGALDAERMTLAPEFIGPRGLESRIDGVAFDDRELDLRWRLLGMRPYREFLIRRRDSTTGHIPHAQVVFGEMRRDRRDIVHVKGDRMEMFAEAIVKPLDR